VDEILIYRVAKAIDHNCGDDQRHREVEIPIE
jgi:hypothetical protein